MQEKGIDISHQTSDVVTTKLLNETDFVITLCKDSMERCPVILPRASHFHWAFDDPAKTRGTEDEILEEFRRVRDEIEATIQKFIQGDTGVAIDFNKNSNLINSKQKDDFGKGIQQIREGKGLSIKDFAEQLQISEHYLSKTENNMTEPSKFFIHRLASVSKVDYDELLDHLILCNK